MKKFVFFLFLISVLTTTTLSAQTEWHWDTHGIAFNAPENFRITKNDASEFEANNSNIYLSIIPWQDGEVSEGNMAEMILGIAKEMKYDNLHDADKLAVSDFSGYFVEGSKDGANAFIACLIDTESSTNMIVIITYNDGFVDPAADILASFHAYDK